MKVAVIGYGSIAKKHIQALSELQYQPEVFALRSQNPSTEIEGVTNFYNEAKLHKINPDFFIISNPTANHFQAIRSAMQLDRPLFIEKPLFSKTGKEESDLIAEIEKRNLKTYVACNLRFLEALQEVKTRTEGQKINEVNVYCGSYLPDWRPGTDFRKVYSANKEMGGGVHIDLIHELDYLYWIFGKPVKTSAHFSNDSSLQISAYDYANYLWQYKGFNANVILNYYRKIPKRTLEIVTENHIYLVDLLKNCVYRDGENIYESSETIAHTYKKQIQFFIEEIVNGNQIFNPVQEAYEILKLCLEEA